MKKISLLFLLLSFLYTANAQTYVNQFKMSPDGTKHIATGTKLVFTVYAVDEKGTLVRPGEQLGCTWTINGVEKNLDPALGKLSTSLDFYTATYQAPEQAPAENPVAIGCSFILRDSAKTKVTLICNVTIVNSTNFFDLQPSDGQNTHYKFDDPFAGTQAHAAMTMAIEKEGELIINITGKAPSPPGDHTVPATMSMVVAIDGTSKGVYEWKTPPENQSVPITSVNVNYSKMGGLRFAYVSIDCLPHPDILHPNDDKCKGFTLKGSTTITKYENPGKVEGYFSGRLVEMDPSGKFIYANIYGRFSANLQKIPGQ